MPMVSRASEPNPATNSLRLCSEGLAAWTLSGNGLSTLGNSRFAVSLILYKLPLVCS